MFGTVLDKLDTFFGRAFLLSRFFPTLIFVVANSAIAYAAFPELRPQLLATLDAAGTATGIIYLLVAFGTITAVTFALAPLGPLTTRFLEGDWLLEHGWLLSLGRSLVLAQALQQQRLAKLEDKLFQDRTALPSADEVKQRLAPLAARGLARNRITDPEATADAVSAVRDLEKSQLIREPISFQMLEATIRKLSEALIYNSPQKDSKLNDAYISFINTILPYAIEIANEREDHANRVKQQKFSHAELAPTHLGNLAASLRSYCKTRYNIDFDSFWPRFLLAIGKDDKLNSAIATAKIQLDFAVLSYALTLGSVVAWIVLLVWLGEFDARLFVAVAFGPPLVVVWLRVVHANYAEFADTVRAAIDNGRFDLLIALHLPLPATLGEERALWTRVAGLAVLNVQEPDIAYKHSST
jgi:hypothetical protein